MALTPHTLDRHGDSVDLAVERPIPFSADAFVESAAGGAAAMTITADASRPIVLERVICSYSAAPAAGTTVTVQDGATTVFKQSTVGAGPFEFPIFQHGTKNQNLTVTLSAGGGAVVAYLNVKAYKLN